LVVFTYDDGSSNSWTGNVAEDWFTKINSALVFSQIHGNVVELPQPVEL